MTPNFGFKYGEHVIVRATGAGVVFGQFVEAEGTAVRLGAGVQMWEWTAAKGICLIDVAVHGVEASKCKFSAYSGDMVVLDACAIIKVNDVALVSLKAAVAK